MSIAFNRESALAVFTRGSERIKTLFLCDAINQSQRQTMARLRRLRMKCLDGIQVAEVPPRREHIIELSLRSFAASACN